ncbi:hypothetical protein HWV62_34667 [Athelia sp. TMB]|nr:hypothetical protein HWV62_34667 [Athelia sp. TMB]
MAREELEEIQFASKGPNTRSVTTRRTSTAMDSSAVNEAYSNKRKAEPETQSAISSKKIKQDEDPLINRSEKYWFEDGNVVIHIEDTYFKLYRGQLARTSNFFANLFTGDESISVRLGDLPLFHLTNVTAHDFALLLEWLDNSIPIFTAAEWPHHPVVASVLRASIVLDFPSLRDAATHILQQEWDSDLQGYLAVTTPILYAANTVVLAKECNLPPAILKRAYYELLVESDFEQSADDADETTEATPLPCSEVYLLIRARSKLQDAWDDVTTFPATLASCPARKTTDKDACKSLVQRKVAWLKIVFESSLAKDYKFDPILGLARLQSADWKAEGICESCVAKMRGEWKTKQEELWSASDEWLGLDTGEEVEVVQLRTQRHLVAFAFRGLSSIK